MIQSFADYVKSADSHVLGKMPESVMMMPGNSTKGHHIALSGMSRQHAQSNCPPFSLQSWLRPELPGRAEPMIGRSDLRYMTQIRGLDSMQRLLVVHAADSRPARNGGAVVHHHYMTVEQSIVLVWSIVNAVACNHCGHQGNLTRLCLCELQCVVRFAARHRLRQL